MDKNIRIGVYFCHCGQNIAGTIELAKVARHVSGLSNVTAVRDDTYLCSSKGQELIRQDIKKLAINRVVIAACSPRLHEKTFQNVLRESGLNPGLLQIANIREQCAWIHQPGQMITEKACRLVSSAVKRVVFHQSMEDQSVSVFPAVLVIGGGIAGIQAALEISNSQQRVYLVEKEPSVGGHMVQFDRTFPTIDCSACVLTPKMEELVHTPFVDLLTNSEVVDVSGYAGNFLARVKRKARYVDEKKCVKCGVCVQKCPRTAVNEFDAGLGLRKAIYIPSVQAIPNTPLIDRQSCDYFNNGKCRTCEEVCPTHAINFEQKDVYLDIHVGSIIVATGFDLYDPTPATQYGYGRLPNVFLSLEFERMCSPSGPTKGIIKLQDGREPKSVAIVHCVGRFNKNINSYCSRVCCMDALKYSRLFKEKTGGDVYQIYVDMCCFGKGYEELYEQVKRKGVNFIKGKLTKISSVNESAEKKIIVTCTDTSPLDSVNITVDMVVLCVALKPRPDAEKIAKMLHLGQSQDGFFLDPRSLSDPVGTVANGIFVAGCCEYPKDISETAVQSSAAAAQSLGMINRGTIQIEAITSSINEDICSGCQVCNVVCPYGAISYDKIRNTCQINKVLCKGCNNCGAACPSGAISTVNFSSNQIMAEIEGALDEL
jgi:heterodisulfide reductase subunit A2